MNLTGTKWVRLADGAVVEVLADPEANGKGNRSLRMLNHASGRRFWATPEGLSRKYRPLTEVEQQ